VYEADPEADPEDVSQWYAANPSLGTSFTEEQFALDLQAAKTSNDRAEWARFLRQRQNRWLSAQADAYFDVEVWDRGRAEEPDLSGCECHLSADLSMTTDPSSVTALYHLGDQRYYVKSWAWVAGEAVKYRERTSLPRYQQFEAEGWMEITDGDRIDDELILDKILDLCRDNDVKTVTFDPTSAVVMMGRVEQATSGVDVRRMTQSFMNFNGPMVALNKAIHEGRIQHDGNNWLRYCLQSLRVEENRHGEIRPITKRSVDHIDGAVALLMGYSAAVQHQDGPACGVEWV
jgi:phage terminase large subunit-like protein